MKTDRDLERHLRDGIGALTPDREAELWARPVELASGEEPYLQDTESHRQSGRRRGLWVGIVAAACLILVLLPYYRLHLLVDAVVYLDVNPSVSLTVNRQERVLDAQPRNADGTVILEEMDLKGANVDVALNALLGSMVKHGYLNADSDLILLSVEGRDPERADTMLLRLTGEADQVLAGMLDSYGVFDQRVEIDDDLEDLAEVYGITPGKAALIQKLAAANHGLRFEDLAGLSMTELAAQLQASGIDLRTYADYTGYDYALDDDDDDWDDDDWDDRDDDRKDDARDDDNRSSYVRDDDDDDDDWDDDDWDDDDD